MRKLLEFLIKFPKIILGIFLCLFLFFGYFSTKLNIDASTQTLLLEDDKNLKTWQEVTKKYGSQNFLVVAFTPKDIFSKDSLQTISSLTKSFEKLDFVDSVISILNVPLFENSKIELSNIKNSIKTLQDGANLDLAKKEFANSSLYTNNLISKDFSATAIVINLKRDLKYENFQDLIQNLTHSKDDTKLKLVKKEFKKYRDIIRDKESKNIEQIREILLSNELAYKNNQNINSSKHVLFLGGMNMIASDMIGYVKNDIIVYGISVFLLLCLCLWLFFKEVKFIVIPMIICLVSGVFASGIFGLLGFEITVISSNFLALQLIITMSIVIHLIVAYREKIKLFPNLSHNKIIVLTLLDRLKPCFFAVFTTIVGFLSLIFSHIKPIISLGIMMSLSISLSFIIAFVLFGIMIVSTEKKYPQFYFEDKFNFTYVCAKIAIYNRKIIYTVVLSIIAFSVFGISFLKVENSFIGYFKKQTPIYSGMEVIDKNLGGTIPLDIVIKFKNNNNITNSKHAEQSDFLKDFEDEFAANDNSQKYWFSSDKIIVLKDVHNFLQNQKFVGFVSSFVNILDVAKKINSGVELDSLSLSLLYENIPQEYKDLIITPYINIDSNEAHFSIRTIDSDRNLRRDEFIKSIKSGLENVLGDRADVQVTGAMLLYNDMLQSLISSQVDTLGVVILSLFLIFVFIFRSLKFAIIAILVNIIPLSLVFATMGILGIPLDIMSITIAAISLGIGVDDVIHYIHRYKIERLKLDIKESIIASHKSIGYAMYYTSFAIFMGFGVMCISNFWPTIYFGVLIDLVMAFMLCAALILLPAFIITFFKTR